MKCEQCDSKKLTYQRDTKEWVCQNCGYIMDINELDLGKETLDPEMSHYGRGAKYSDPYDGLGSFISRKDRIKMNRKKYYKEEKE